MIICKAPFRVSFCGGGSDIPAFYEKYGGCVLSCSIKKYMYISIHPSFDENTITLKYSKTEVIDRFDDIEHKYFKILLKKYNVKGVEITSIADIPSGTGLGSSSSFTVATLKALKEYKKLNCSTYDLASEACEVEINDAKSPIGKQDQFAAAFGGLNFITFCKNGDVIVEPVKISKENKKILQQNLMLFYTGLTHDANAILSEQSFNIVSKQDKISAQMRLCDMARSLKQHLEDGDVDYLGQVLKESWEIKKTLSSGISNPTINSIYELAIKSGAIGGKLLGAGGGGFMLFYVKPSCRDRVKESLSNYREIDFEIDYEGASLIYDGK